MSCAGGNRSYGKYRSPAPVIREYGLLAQKKTIRKDGFFAWCLDLVSFRYCALSLWQGIAIPVELMSRENSLAGVFIIGTCASGRSG